MKTFAIAAALSTALLTSSAMAAGDLEQWGTGGGWDIMVDTTIGDGCFIQAEFEDGSLVRIGLDPDEEMGFVSAFNDAWGDIEDGAYYDIEFDLDGERYVGEAKGLWLGDLPGADILFDNLDFFLSIAEKNVMTLYNTSGEVMAISLAGTQSGLEGVLECQADVDGG